MELDIEKRLFDIPADVEFPMELCHHLKSKFHGIVEQNCNLKRHVDYLDNEVKELRKFKLENQQPTCLCSSIQENGLADRQPSLMASKLVELSKKNRDMTAQIESMKTKMTKLLTENETLRIRQTTGVNNLTTQLEKLTQELKIRQQELKAVELRKLKLEKQQEPILQKDQEDIDPSLFLMTVKVDEMSKANSDMTTQIDSMKTKMTKLLTENEKLRVCQTTGTRKLSTQLEQLTQELKSRQQELKASKARNQTLESQARSFRCQIDLQEAQIQEKDSESKTTWNEITQLKQELLKVKDRDKRNSDKTSLEIQEANRALARERAMISRLQQVINEKQEALQKADGEMIELRNKLELCCSRHVNGGLDAIERIQEIEIQLQQSSELIASREHERQRLVEILEGAINETEHERQKVIQAQRHSAKVFTVLQQANKCIDDCLDAAQITDTSLLQEVENIRTLIRELRTGELYSLDLAGSVTSVKKLRTKVNMLNEEVKILQSNLHELAEARKADLNNYKLLSAEAITK